jgi:hypothetical protein
LVRIQQGPPELLEQIGTLPTPAFGPVPSSARPDPELTNDRRAPSRSERRWLLDGWG